MTVILSKDCIQFPQAAGPCTICTGPLFPPFIFWLCEGQLTICYNCIEGAGKGLMADLIQARAIIDLQTLYPGFTLERKWIRNLKSGGND